MKIEYKGSYIATHYGKLSLPDAIELVKNVDDDEVNINDIVLTPNNDFEKRHMIREEISRMAGDTESILGTTTDAMHMLFHAFSKHIIALKSASSLADVNAASDDFLATAESFLEHEEDGCCLPYKLKGEESVLEDIKIRAISVSDIISKVPDVIAE